MKGTATGAAPDSNRSNATAAMASSGRQQVSRDINKQMATTSLQSRNRNGHGSRKRASLASNHSMGQKRVTFNQLTSQVTVDSQNAEINNQSVPLDMPEEAEDASARHMHTAGEHEGNEGGADESPGSVQKPKKKQQIKTVKINSKISQQRDSMQTAASRKQPAVLNSRSIQLESSQQLDGEVTEKEQYELGASYLDQEKPLGYDDIDEDDVGVDDAFLLITRQQRRKSRYLKRIDAFKEDEELAAREQALLAPASEQQHQNITIHSPHDSDQEHLIVESTPQPSIQVQQVSEQPVPGINDISKTEVPVFSPNDLSEDTSQAATGMNLNLMRDASVDKNNSIISEVDPAFEEQTPNHRDQSKEQLQLGCGPSQPALATFQQRSLSNVDPPMLPDCETPREVRASKKDEAKVHDRKGRAAQKLLIGSKKAVSGNYEHMIIESAHPKMNQKTPLHGGPASSVHKGQAASWNFNLKSKIKRMQTVGRQPQRSSNRNAIISKSPLKNSPSINSKGMFTAFDIESAISRQKQSTGRRGRFEGASRFRRDDRNGSSLNLTVDNQLDQLSLNIGKVTGPLRNAQREQLLSSEGRQFEYDIVTGKDAITPGQGTFSMLSSNKGKAMSPFMQVNRLRKKSNEPCQEIIASSTFRKNKMIISSGPIAKRSSTMRQNKGGNEDKTSKILDHPSQLSEQDMMKRSGGVGSANSKYDVAFEDDENSEFIVAVDTDGLVRQRIESSNKKMMAVYTRNPYKVKSIDAIKQLEKQHSGVQPQLQKSHSRQRKPEKMTKLYRAENQLALRNKRRSRASVHKERTSISSPKCAGEVSIHQDGSLTGRNHRSEGVDDATDQSAHLVHLLQRLQEQDANQGAVEKEFRLCLYQQVERELEKRERLLSQQVTWLRKQKQLCEVYGQSLSHVVHAMTQVPEHQKQSKDSVDGRGPKRLKNLNAELLQPVPTRKRKEEQVVAMHDPTMAASILAESVPEPREIVYTKQTDGLSQDLKPSSMVAKRHSEQIREQLSPNYLLTSSLNSNSAFHNSNMKEANNQSQVSLKSANHLLHQLVSICQRLRYSPDKVSYLRSLLRSVERYDHEMRKLLRHTYKKSPHTGHRKSVDTTPAPLLSNFIEGSNGIDEAQPSDSEIRFYKLSLIQLNRLIQANKIHSTIVKMDMSKHSPAITTQFNSFHIKENKAVGGLMQSPMGDSTELASMRNDISQGLNTSVPPRNDGEHLIDYFDRKLMERKSLETATKFGTGIPNSTRNDIKVSLVKRALDEDNMEEVSKEPKNFFAEDSVGEVRISHSHKKTIQKYRKKRKDLQGNTSVSKDGGIDFIKENKKNLLPFFTQQMTDRNQSMSPQKEKQNLQPKQKEKKTMLQSQKVGAFTQSNSPSLEKYKVTRMPYERTTESNGFIASGSLSGTQRNSQVSAVKPKVHETATSSVSNSEHVQRERLSQQRVPLPEPIKVKDNRTNFDITREYAPNLNSATSQQRVVVGHLAANEHSPIRQRKNNVMNEVRSSRHKLIQSGHQIISDQSNRKNMLNFQLKHVSQKVPTSFLESQYDARLGQFNFRDKQSDYVSSSIIEASQQQSRFQSSKTSKALANVLEQQRELNRGMRNQKLGVTQQMPGSRLPGHRRNNLSMTGCTVTSGSGKMSFKGSYGRDQSSVDDLGGQEILAQSATHNKLIRTTQKQSELIPVMGSSTAMPNTMAYNGSSIAVSSHNDSRILPDRIRDAEPQQ